MVSFCTLQMPLRALSLALLAMTISASPLNSPQYNTKIDFASVEILTKAADAQVQPIIDGKEDILKGEPRGVAHAVRQLIAPFVWPNSSYFHDESLLEHVDEMLDLLVKVQHDDGTYTVGNRHSPPDTGFLIDDYGMLVRMLEKDDHTSSQARAETIYKILVKAAPAMFTGGIHTPNHRWKLCGALARISTITKNDTLVSRIDQWLAEGIDIDPDGIYSERSPIYYGAVTNPSLLVVAHELNRPELRVFVRKNLELVIEHAEPNGEVETVMSRRQDQAQKPGINLKDFYPQFRELALHDNNGRFAAMARHIEDLIPDQLGDYLGTLIERPDLAAILPEAEEPFVDYKKHYATANLVRERRGKLTTSVFGGTDWYDKQGQQSPFFNRFGSGLSTNPTMFRAWNGEAVLEAVRLLPNFFSMGHFRSAGVGYNETSGASKLGSEYAVSYFLPIESEHINNDGEYDLSRAVPDGRFYAMLDFENRPTSQRSLKTDVEVVPTQKGYDLVFEVTGEENVEIMLELTFRPNGTITATVDGGLEDAEGTQEEDGAKILHLIEGMATYTSGHDSITFGPGQGKGLILGGAGEQYSWMNGKLELSGHRVYITGVSPFEYTLRLEFS